MELMEEDSSAGASGFYRSYGVGRVVGDRDRGRQEKIRNGQPRQELTIRIVTGSRVASSGWHLPVCSAQTYDAIAQERENMIYCKNEPRAIRHSR
jgi:hypothetical protein